jgi:hypothetical protein
VSPQPANPPVLRVAMLAPAASVVAAISASNFSIGFPCPAGSRLSTLGVLVIVMHKRVVVFDAAFEQQLVGDGRELPPRRDVSCRASAR